MFTKHPVLVGLVVAIATLATALGGMSIAKAATPASGAQPFIVGGQDATQSWTVSLQSVGASGPAHECGGVLIAPKWVMTAAHCTPYVTGQARIGSTNWKQGGEVVPVSQVFAHPDHDSSKNFGNDLALVKLKSSAKSKPVAIGVYGPVGSTGLTQGWGITCDADVTAPGCGDQVPNKLQQLGMNRAADTFCNLTNASGVQLNDPATMMCLVTANNAKAGICFGDSGSPYLQTKYGVKTVTGIIIALMNNTVPSPHVCSQTPDGGPNRDAATKIAPLLPWVIKTLVKNDPGAAQFVQGNLVVH